MITLGIETSCDETAVALYDSDKGLVGEAVFSQIKLHAEYGGVIPELASRDHCQKITHIYKKALGDIHPSNIDQIAYTAGPGLLGTLGRSQDPAPHSFWLEIETVIGLERLAISNERPLSKFHARTFRHTLFLMSLLSRTFKNTKFLISLLMLIVILGPKLRPHI